MAYITDTRLRWRRRGHGARSTDLRKFDTRPAEAVLVAFSVQYYVMGFVIEEQAAYDLTRANSAQAQRNTAIDVERFPNITAGLKTLRNTPRDTLFAYGLTRLLADTDRSS